MSDHPAGDGQSKDVLLGKKALARGWITQDQLRDALAERFRESPDTRTLPPLRQVLLARGYLSKDQIDRLLTENEGPDRGAPPPPAAPANGASAFRPGATFGKYALVRELGRGGMGVVYEAVDQVLKRSVALKVLHDASPARAEFNAMQEKLFLKEARLAASLPPHPHIVVVHEADVIDSKRYLTMELVQGRPMNEWREMGVTLRGQVALLRDIARAIHHAHANGVIHCDLKPRNVLVDARNQPRLTDFGLAKSLRRDPHTSPDGSGVVLGTPAYMSPEQIEGVTDLDARSDVYSLGVMLYEILTNRVPFQGMKPMETAFKVLYEPLPRPSEAVGAKGDAAPDPALEKVCVKALARKPEDRHQTAESLAAELDRWLEQRSNASVTPGPPKLVPRILGLAAAAAIATAAFYATRPRPVQSPAPPAAAPREAERVVNLLPMIDPARDARSGTWTFEGGRLRSDSSLFGKIEILYAPPEEYDLRFEFERREGSGDVNAILSRDGRNFAWLMAGWGNSTFGFETVAGVRADHNPTSVRRASCLENGKAYECVVKVRRDRVEASLNGETISSWKTDFRDLSIAREWALRDSHHLGLATYSSVVEFRRLEVVERAAPSPR